MRKFRPARVGPIELAPGILRRHMYAFFYAAFFSKVAKAMKVPKNTKPYEYVEIPLTCKIAHRGLCAYAVIPAALRMHLSIPEFMQFVLDIMTCRHNRLTKKSTLKLLDDYRAGLVENALRKRKKKKEKKQLK